MTYFRNANTWKTLWIPDRCGGSARQYANEPVSILYWQHSG
jgi:hypothetical protein